MLGLGALQDSVREGGQEVREGFLQVVAPEPSEGSGELCEPLGNRLS